MKCVIPRFRKVFCCLPLRRGVITLVYINLLPSALLGCMIYFLDVSKFIFRAFTMRQEEMYHRMYRSKISPMAMALILLGFWLAELSMTVVALVGLHKKNLRLVKIFLHYTVGVTIFIVFVRMLDVIPIYWQYDVCTTLLFASFKLYFILMQRSLVKKMIDDQIEEPKDPQLELVIPIDELAVNSETFDGLAVNSETIDGLAVNSEAIDGLAVNSEMTDKVELDLGEEDEKLLKTNIDKPEEDLIM